jgi:mannose-1-phosphate guanylyltransferase / mannose-6-phosphate isomerase
MERHAVVNQDFPWGTIEWLAGGEVGNSRELSLARLVIAPGKAGDTHVHANCEESIYVIRGEVACRIGVAITTLGAGRHAVVPRGAVHSLSNGGDSPAELVLGYSAAVREFALAD